MRTYTKLPKLGKYYRNTLVPSNVGKVVGIRMYSSLKPYILIEYLSGNTYALSVERFNSKWIPYVNITEEMGKL